MHGLTKRQTAILDYIEKYIGVNRHSPSYRTIQKHFDLSSLGTISNIMRALKKKGALVQDSRKAQPVKKLDLIEVPLVGTLTGSGPLKMHEKERTLSLPSYLADETAYLLKVAGNGFKDQALLDGDFIVIEPRDPEVGEMTLAEVAGSHSVIGHYGEAEGGFLLDGMFLRHEHVRLLGTITSLFRDLSL